MISLAVSVCLKIRCMRWNKYYRLQKRSRLISGNFMNAPAAKVAISWIISVLALTLPLLMLLTAVIVSNCSIGCVLVNSPTYFMLSVCWWLAVPSRLPSMKKAFAIFFIAPISAPPPTFLILAAAFVFTNRLTQPTGNLISWLLSGLISSHGRWRWFNSCVVKNRQVGLLTFSTQTS